MSIFMDDKFAQGEISLYLLTPCSETGTQQGESADDMMADLWPPDSPSVGGETSTWHGADHIANENPDDVIAGPWPPDSPSDDSGINSAADAICIDLMGSDDEEGLTELDDDDELPRLSVLLQRAKRQRDRRVG